MMYPEAERGQYEGQLRCGGAGRGGLHALALAAAADKGGGEP